MLTSAILRILPDEEYMNEKRLTWRFYWRYSVLYRHFCASLCAVNVPSLNAGGYNHPPSRYNFNDAG